MSLSTFLEELKLLSGQRVVGQDGRLTPDFWRWLYLQVSQADTDTTAAQTTADTAETTATTAQTTATTAQTTAEAAARTSAYAEKLPASVVWRSDTAGVYPASNPTEDIQITFYDETGTQVAQRVLRGTLTSANGNIAITAVSNSASTGYSTAYTLVDDGTASVLAQVTLTFPDTSEMVDSLSWTSIDVSAAGTTPVTGGGK